MTYIILKKVEGQWPKVWTKVCTLKNLLPSNSFLKTQYGLSSEHRLNVIHSKRSNSKYHWKGYRTATKHIFNGTVAEFEEFCREWYKKNVWSKLSKTDISKASGSLVPSGKGVEPGPGAED